MSGCEITPLCSDKACTSKCSTLGADAPVWVLAACEGAGIVFKRLADGGLLPVSQKADTHSPLSMQAVSSLLSRALQQHEFSQLMVVGSPVDIIWAHAALPDAVTRYVIAEVPYPLMASWFAGEAGFSTLTMALENVVGVRPAR